MKHLLILIFLFNSLCIASSLQKQFPIKDLNDILILKRTIKPQITDSKSIVADIWQIEKFDGNYIIVDPHTSKKINVFTPQSKYIKTLNKSGEGPGEFGRPEFIIPVNNTLHVFGYPPAKRLIFDRKFNTLSETKSGVQKLDVFSNFGHYHENKYFFQGKNIASHTKRIVVTDLKFKPKSKFREIEEANKYVSMDYIKSIIVNDKLWVTRMFDPYVDIFDLKTGSLIKTIGKELKRPPNCLYSYMLANMKKGERANNFAKLFKVISKKRTCNTLINIDNKIVLYGAFFTKESDGRKRRHFDVYDSEGNLLQQEVLLKQEFKSKEDTFYTIPRSSSNRLFLINTNLTEDEEEDYSSIIYEYSVK